MKKYIVAVVLIAFSLSGFAQDKQRDDRREQMKALQIAFVTEKLSLTPEESQTFWPIHNAFEEKSSAVRSKSRKIENVEEMSDEEAMNFVNTRISIDEELVVLRKEYVQDLKSVLSPKKIAMLFAIEHEFKRKMLKNIREQRHDKRKNKK
jgi:hypothetical protein